jgi:hypothetical protein
MNLVKIAVGTLALSLASAAFGSGYPADYSYQNVRVITDGPALFAHVGSGCGSAEVIGYKTNGMLAANNPDRIDAVVTTSCTVRGEYHLKNSTVTLGREWHGAGYVSEAHSFYDYLPQACMGSDELAKIHVGMAFSANGQWDSKFGANYGYNGYGFYNTSDVRSYSTNTQGCSGVNLPGWEAIVNELAN